MKIFLSQQTRKIDQLTIEKESITSLELMERASQAILKWLLQRYASADRPFYIFCGPGNNGGDGLAVARMLDRHEKMVYVYRLAVGQQSSDNAENWSRLPKTRYLQSALLTVDDELPAITKDAIVIDALFGSGLSRPLMGLSAKLVQYINTNSTETISIDVPSGLFADHHTSGIVIRANHTLTLQFPKLSLLMPENQDRTGEWHAIDIGLNSNTIDQEETPYHLIDSALVAQKLFPRRKFDHKGSFGHALLICGGFGMAGAAILSSRACLRSGVGLLTVHIPGFAYQIIQTSVPEAMVEIDVHKYWFTRSGDLERYAAVGVGCGLATNPSTCEGFRTLITESKKPLIIDADGINILAKNRELLASLPNDSILTPHPGEFQRLFDDSLNDFVRLEKQIALSAQYGIHIVLKGAHTCITGPSGNVYFNNSGNPGMATAGSGDVLTGIVTSFVAQGHTTSDACIIATYVHGLAGDLGAEKMGQEGLVASDIVDHIGLAIRNIRKSK